MKRVLPLLAVMFSVPVMAGPDRVKFPADHKKGILYATVDRHDNKQVRELYTSAEAAEAAKARKPLPDGTVITMLIYKAQVDAEGKPVKDANGRFVKGDLANVAAMEQRAGWGADYGDDIRNGDWEYSMFNADGAFNEKADIKSCFNCHKPHDKQNYVMSWAQLAGTSFEGSAKTASADGVVIKDFVFGPANYSTAPGKAITFINTDASPHQIVVQGKNLKTGVLQKGQSDKVTLDEPGTYNYNCTLHPGMKGTLEVK